MRGQARSDHKLWRRFDGVMVHVTEMTAEEIRMAVEYLDTMYINDVPDTCPDIEEWSEFDEDAAETKLWAVDWVKVFRAELECRRST